MSHPTNLSRFAGPTPRALSNELPSERKISDQPDRMKKIALDWSSQCVNCHRSAWDQFAPKGHSSPTCPAIAWQHQKLIQLKQTMREANQKCADEKEEYDLHRTFAFHCMQKYDAALKNKSIDFNEAIQAGEELVDALKKDYRLSQNGVEGSRAAMNYFEALLEDFPENQQYQTSYENSRQTYTQTLGEMVTRENTLRSVEKELNALKQVQKNGGVFQRMTKFHFPSQQ